MTTRTGEVEMKMPDLAATESEVKVVRWLVGEGQAVKRGQAVVEVETDKATMEVESTVTGVLRSTCAKAGEVIAVGQVIAVFATESFTASAPDSGENSAQAGATAPARRSSGDTDPSEAGGPTRGGYAPSGVTDPGSERPAAKAKPTGMFARNRAAAAAPPRVDDNLPLSVAQRTAGRRLRESKQTVPHFYLQTSVNAARMVAQREAAGPQGIAWDAFFVFAAARALERFERLACRVEGDHLVKANTEAIGVAVDHEGDLYVVPVEAPPGKAPAAISADLRAAVVRLRGGDPEARRMRPARMTITNLGVCGVESFIPIINPPEAAILGIGKVAPVPVARADGRIAVERRATLTLAVDHRVVSGKYAGDFLAALVGVLESL